jgi:hypothetical protein
VKRIVRFGPPSELYADPAPTLEWVDGTWQFGLADYYVREDEDTGKELLTLDFTEVSASGLNCPFIDAVRIAEGMVSP